MIMCTSPSADNQPQHRSPSDPWRARAACIDTDPRMFTDPHPDTDDTARAIERCHGCAVRQPCLTEALTHPAATDVGIWGATTPEQRRAMRATPDPPPPYVGLFDTLEGDLTDLTGRAQVAKLPVTPSLLLVLDGRAILRTSQLEVIQRHLAENLDDYQPSRLAPLVLTSRGELADPAGRIAITRLPVAPHLLVVVDNRPHLRAASLAEARQHALRTLALLHPRPLPPARRPGQQPAARR